MPTLLGSNLTQGYRNAQGELSRQTIAEIEAIWPTVSFLDLNGTWPEWLIAVTAIIQRQRLVASSIAELYLQAFRRAEGVPGRLRVLKAPPAPEAQITTSMNSTGLSSIKKLTAEGVAEPEVMQTALTRVSGASQRLVANAGRTTVIDTVHNDPQALGWARRLTAPSCAFCVLLATRGAVYKTQGSADFPAHDHCDCATEPVYGEFELQPDVAGFLELYKSSTGGKSGKAAIHAFASAYRKATGI